MNKEIMRAEFNKIDARFKDGIIEGLKTFIEKQNCTRLTYGTELLDMFLAENNDIDPDVICYDIAAMYCSLL